MRATRNLLLGVLAALAALSTLTPASEARPYRQHCRYFNAGGQTKLYCRDRYSGWQAVEDTRQPYGGPDYNARWRHRNDPIPQTDTETETPTAPRESNYASEPAPSQSKLELAIDKVVAVDAQSWVLNRFDRGSVYDATVEERDGSGTASAVFARYTYNGGNRGWVRIRLSGRRLSCMEFWDFAGTCRGLGHSPSHLVALTAAVAAVGIAAAASSSGHHSGSSVSDGGTSDTYYDRQQSNNNNPPPEPEPDQQRTYGLYGNCPQPGAGYGC